MKDGIDSDENEIFTNVASVAEIISKVRRRNRDTDMAWGAIVAISKMIEISGTDSKEVGFIQARMIPRRPNFGLADAFVLAAAKKLGGKVLTGDSDFRGIEDVIMIQ